MKIKRFSFGFGKNCSPVKFEFLSKAIHVAHVFHRTLSLQIRTTGAFTGCILILKALSTTYSLGLLKCTCLQQNHFSEHLPSFHFTEIHWGWVLINLQNHEFNLVTRRAQTKIHVYSLYFFFICANEKMHKTKFGLEKKHFIRILKLSSVRKQQMGWKNIWNGFKNFSKRSFSPDDYDHA